MFSEGIHTALKAIIASKKHITLVLLKFRPFQLASEPKGRARTCVNERLEGRGSRGGEPGRAFSGGVRGGL